MAEMSKRLDRGLLTYEKCSYRQLYRFMRKRKIRGKGNTSPLVLLRNADEDLKFHRFLDLPPELRVQIYEYYVRAVTEPCFSEELQTKLRSKGKSPTSQALSCPTQTPLARTCRLLRQEVLPVFYNLHTFVLDFNFKIKYNADYNTLTCIRLLSDTMLFLYSVGNEQMSHIHRFQLKVRGTENRVSKVADMLELNIDLQDPHDTKGLLSHSYDPGDSWFDSTMNAVVSNVRKTLQTMKEVNGKKGLPFELLGSLSRAIESA